MVLDFSLGRVSLFNDIVFFFLVPSFSKILSPSHRISQLKPKPASSSKKRKKKKIENVSVVNKKMIAKWVNGCASDGRENYESVSCRAPIAIPARLIKTTFSSYLNIRWAT